MRIFYLLLFIPVVFNCPAQILTKESKQYITTFEAPNSKNLTAFIKTIAKDKRIIGLGEVSHYTKECYLLKQEIIKALIKEGFDGLVLEVDFGQALIWNDYVVNGTGNLDSIIAKSGWFTYRTEEFKKLIGDIRKHNETTTTPFQIFGMEMTAINHNLDWLTTNLSDFDAAKGIIQSIQKERKTIAFAQYNSKERVDYWQLYGQLQNFITENETALLTEKGAQITSITKQIIEITRQYATYISQDDFGLKSEFRDQFSARNVYWCMKQMGENSKIVLWAHNGHVTKHSIMNNYDVLGHYLNKWFENAYYAIGFGFNEGEIGAFSNNGFQYFQINNLDTISITRDFHQLKTPYLIYDVQAHLKANNSPDLFLRQSVLSRRDFSESFNEGWEKIMTIDLSKSYDAYIYIDKTSSPTSIPWKR